MEDPTLLPEEWYIVDLFNYAVANELIEEDSEFEDWKNDRPGLLEMVIKHMEE